MMPRKKAKKKKPHGAARKSKVRKAVKSSIKSSKPKY